MSVITWFKNLLTPAGPRPGRGGNAYVGGKGGIAIGGKGGDVVGIHSRSFIPKGDDPTCE